LSFTSHASVVKPEIFLCKYLWISAKSYKLIRNNLLKSRLNKPNGNSRPLSPSVSVEVGMPSSSGRTDVDTVEEFTSEKEKIS
jgi:hypothetical protein